ncbi:hypothetical protein C8R46DRAFT_1218790 [Mycena filopes]|nr:hypothetical protein C8R46DRAFT_1218790 [Mycena filopes]
MNIPPNAVAFTNINDFSLGLVISCDHKSTHIDTTAQAPPGSTGKIRPCLIVHINKSKAEVYLAPFTSSEESDHPGWMSLRKDPKITHYGSSMIWIGGPAKTPVIIGSVGEMYWSKNKAAYDVAEMQVNLANYWLRRKEYVAKHGTNDEAILEKVETKRAKLNSQGSAAQSHQSSRTVMPPPSNASRNQAFGPTPERQGAYPGSRAIDPTALAFIPRARQNVNVAPSNFNGQSFPPQAAVQSPYQTQVLHAQQQQAQAMRQQQAQAIEQQRRADEARLRRLQDPALAGYYASQQGCKLTTFTSNSSLNCHLDYNPAGIFQDLTSRIWYYTQNDGSRGPHVVRE